MATATKNRKINYPSTDGKPVAESEVHLDVLSQALAVLRDHLRNRIDVAINGNLFVYYERGNPKKCLAPDLFVSFGVPRMLRQTYKVWEEGKYPDIVMEFTSAKTRKEDMIKKYKIYQDVWKVPEYFLFDPTGDYIDPPVRGYGLTDRGYTMILADGDRVESKVLGLTLEPQLRFLLFRDAKTGEPILTADARRAKLAEEEIQRLKTQMAADKNHSSNGHG